MGTSLCTFNAHVLLFPLCIKCQVQIEDDFAEHVLSIAPKQQ